MNNHFCKATNKYIYSSEAKANRALNRYSDIKRVYMCESCETEEGFNGWHTTSLEEEDMEDRNLDYFKREFKEVKPSVIRKKLNKLIKKQNND